MNKIARDPLGAAIEGAALAAVLYWACGGWAWPLLVGVATLAVRELQ